MPTESKIKRSETFMSNLTGSMAIEKYERNIITDHTVIITAISTLDTGFSACSPNWLHYYRSCTISAANSVTMVIV